jgi:hypothetical protein
MARKTVFKQADALLVVRLLLELQGTTVLHELLEFIRVALAKLGQRSFNLLFLNGSVFFIFRSARKSLPRQCSLQKVEEHMANCLQIVASGLLDTFMSCNRSVTRGTSQVLSINIWNVHALRVLVALSKSKINNINSVFIVLRATDQEVVGLNISMNDSFFMHFLNAGDHLNSNE